ncbi:hypothetical protein [Deinococcus multiflagellatus]|uniref:MFS transporter n=1 Tax=Deinococcus multiflagellatus TaxID=1656887 RepID=A0ABW1ZME8_9DEIO
MAGAAGTALLVALMAGRAAQQVAAGVAAPQAQVAGLHLAFLVAAGVGVLAVGLALGLRSSGAAHPTATDTATDEAAPLAQPGD